MPSGPILTIFLIFMMWLFSRDQKLRPMTSLGLWIPLLWVMIIGTRYVSSWSTVPVEMLSPEELLAGNPLDRNIFLFLLTAGALVLYQRRHDLGRIFHSNRWFFVFFIYCGISVIWSDYPFVSLKRWAKELGNVIMVLIIVTEMDPVQATRAVFVRYAHLVVPLSIVLIYLFPDFGVYYDHDKIAPTYGGVTTNKNTLGIITYISGVLLAWELIHLRSADRKVTNIMDLFGHILLLLMVAWLMYLAQSATSLVCIILGIVILLFMKFPLVIRQTKYLGTYGVIFGLLVLSLYSLPGILEYFAGILGRDATFHGRTQIWLDVLAERINPLFGTGYQGFWLGDRAAYYWEIYPFHIKQAHNGYLEIYLNGGLIGVSLLMAMILSTGGKLKAALPLGNNFSVLLLAYFVTALFYNYTEASFSDLSLLWFMLSIAALYSPLSPADQRMIPRVKAAPVVRKIRPPIQTESRLSK